MAMLVTVVLGCMVVGADAQDIVWTSRGIGMATSANSEYMNYSYAITPNFKNMNITDDAQGGVIMCWMANVTGSYTIFAQRADGAGRLLWTTAPSGVQVAQPTGGFLYPQQYMPQCVADGNGGAYISWLGHDYANGTYHPFVQHMSSSGVPLWGKSGAVLAAASDVGQNGYPYIPQMDRDGKGGVWVVWYSCPDSTTNASYGHVCVARVGGADAQPTFAYSGVLRIQTMSPAEFLERTCNPVLCSDSVGNAYVAYQTQAGADYKNHVVKISASTGAIAFNTIASTSPNPSYGFNGYNIVPDGSGGAILNYLQHLQYYNDVPCYDQMMGVRVGNAGNVVWGPSLTHQVAEFFQYPGGKIAADGSGGAYLLRYDNWNYYTPAMQHIDSMGNQLWSPTNLPSGISVTTAGQYDQVQNAQVAADPFGNAITVYANGNRIFLQKWFRKSGLPLQSWPASQFVFGAGTNPQVVPDGVGGAFVGWNQTSTGYDIYAQHVVDTLMAPRAKLSGASAIAVGSARVGASAAIASITIANRAATNSSLQLPLKIFELRSLRGICSTAGPGFPVSVPVGDSIVLTFRVSPKRNGPFLDTVIVFNNDPFNSQIPVVITGTGMYPHLQTNSSVAFPPIRVGGTAPYQQSLPVSNTGTDTLRLTGATMQGADAGSFSVLGGAVQTIPAGSTGIVTIGFLPGTATPKSATLQLASDDSLNPVGVQVTGAGIYPHPQLAAALQFPNTLQDRRTSVRGLVVANTGTERLVLTAANISGTDSLDFSVLTPLPDTIPSGGSSQVNVQFAPKRTFGSRSATLSLASNFDSTMQVFGTDKLRIALAGNSVGSAAEPQFVQQIDCGAVHLGQSDTVTFHISNASSASEKLIVASYSLTGATAQYFSLVNAPHVPDTVLIGASRDIRIRFAASVIGMRTASLEMLSSAAAAALVVPVFGAGIKGTLHAESLDFGLVGANTCSDTVLHVANLGTDTLTVASLDISGMASPLFHVVSGVPVRLSPSATADVHVRFCPVARQRDSVAGRFVTGDGDTVALMLFGRGVNSGALRTDTVVDYGLVALQQPVTRALAVTNTGDIPVTILTAKFTNATTPVTFSTDLQTPAIVYPGESITVNVLFKSNTGGPKSASLVLTTAKSVLTVALSAAATSDPYVITPEQLFDTILVPGSGAVESVLLRNFTTSSLNVRSIAITGPGANYYTILYPITWPYSIDVFTSDSILVGYRPLFAGGHLAVLTIVVEHPSDTHLLDTIRVALSGQAEPRSGVAQGLDAPTDIIMLHNYPNPCAGVTQCMFVLPERGRVELTVHDLLGRAVRSVVDAVYDAGVHVETMDVSVLPPGTYSCELRTGSTLRRCVIQVVK